MNEQRNIPQDYQTASHLQAAAEGLPIIHSLDFHLALETGVGQSMPAGQFGVLVHGKRYGLSDRAKIGAVMPEAPKLIKRQVPDR